MLRIRLLRVGKKNSPSFRLIVTERRNSPKTGNFLEILGFYNPLLHTKAFKKERVLHWLSQGAQASDTVYNMLVKEGIVTGKKIPAHKKPKKSKEQKETAESKPKETAESAVA
jgi:small subunit ribosomal protein S16